MKKNIFGITIIMVSGLLFTGCNSVSDYINENNVATETITSDALVWLNIVTTLFLV